MIQFDEEALADLERILFFNAEKDRGWALEQIEKIESAVMILDKHPHIGPPVEGTELRELVISVGKTGHIALYQYAEPEGLVRVLAVRRRSEAGYRGR